MHVNFVTSINKNLWLHDLPQKFFYDPYIQYRQNQHPLDMDWQVVGQAPDLYGDRARFLGMRAAVNACHKRLLPKLAGRFAAVHLKGDARFWQRLLSFHLRIFMGLCYFTYDRMRTCFRPDTHRLKIYAEPPQSLFGDMGDIWLKSTSHDMSDLLVAEYMHLFFPEQCEEIPYHQSGLPEEAPPPPPIRGFWSKLCGKSLTGLLAALMRRTIPLQKTRMGLYRTSLNGADALLLRSRGNIRDVDAALPAFTLPTVRPKDAALRDALCRDLAAQEDAFERYFLHCFQVHCPWIMAEGFAQAYTHYESCWERLPRLSHVIMESWMLRQQALLAVLAAGERGIPWIFHEHVACNMLMASSFSRDILDIPDIYLSSGWGQTHGSFIRGGSLSSLRTPRRDSHIDLLLLLGPHYAYMGSVDPASFHTVGPKNFEVMESFLSAFFARIAAQTKRRILVKTHPRHDTNDDMYELDTARLAGEDLAVFSAQRWNGSELMAQSRLTIINYLSTPVFEAFTSNFPCIIMYPEERYIWDEDFKNAYDGLRAAGVVHTDPETAAMQVERVKDDPEGWWMSAPVQEAVSQFCRKYFAGPQKAFTELSKIYQKRRSQGM